MNTANLARGKHLKISVLPSRDNLYIYKYV